MSKFERVDIQDGYITLGKKCSVTGTDYSITVLLADYNRWKAGELAQTVFENMEPEEREFLISGITPDEWDVMFGDEDYEYDFSDDVGLF